MTTCPVCSHECSASARAAFDAAIDRAREEGRMQAAKGRVRVDELYEIEQRIAAARAEAKSAAIAETTNAWIAERATVIAEMDRQRQCAIAAARDEERERIRAALDDAGYIQAAGFVRRDGAGE
jgi:hypothetical protein